MEDRRTLPKTPENYKVRGGLNRDLHAGPNFLPTCLRKTLVDFRFPAATNLKLKAFEGRA
jgi:hypothetical protein